jgi:hypothetical protein
VALLPLQDRECEHLRQIIKELSQSRAKVQKTKVELEEQFVALQKEYYRCAGTRGEGLVHWSRQLKRNRGAVAALKKQCQKRAQASCPQGGGGDCMRPEQGGGSLPLSKGCAHFR